MTPVIRIIKLILLIATIVASTLPIIFGVQDFQEMEIETHLGGLKVSMIGPKEGRPAVALHGMNPALVDEWFPVAQRLAARGYRICLPNFHSNRRLSPREVSHEDLMRVIREHIIAGALGAQQVVMMGKSWGGGNAALFAASHRELVHHLVLAAPAQAADSVLPQLQQSSLPVFLAWAEDDKIMPSSRARSWQQAIGSALTQFTVPTGGHSIFIEYVEPIAAFLQT